MVPINVIGEDSADTLKLGKVELSSPSSFSNHAEELISGRDIVKISNRVILERQLIHLTPSVTKKKLRICCRRSISQAFHQCQ
jgi:hypothetical protein